MWLTGRSTALIAVAAVSLVVAFLVGVPALLYVIGLCAGLVVVAVAVSVVSRPRITAVRTVTPAVAEQGETIEVRIDLTIDSVVPVVTDSWRDRIDSGLQGQARGTAPTMDRRQQAHVTYEVVGRRRGSHVLGPLSVVVGDAFGLTERAVKVDVRDRVVVLPARTPLEPVTGPGASADGVTRTRRSSGLGHDDVIARPYLPGDALKRWHWKATAHHGEPMVRQEESELRPTVQVVLAADPRLHDHAGFEWNVSAAASIVSHYAGRGYDVDLVSAGVDLSLDSGHGLTDALIALALLEPSSAPVTPPTGDGTTFVLMGRPDRDTARRIVGEVHVRDAIVFVAPATSAAAYEVLDKAGWHVVTLHADEELTEAWARTGTVARS